MKESEIHVYARELLRTEGPKAIAEAAKRAASFEGQGDKEQAETWRRIQTALLEMRGPRET